MRLPFLNRSSERERLTAAFARPEGSLCCVYGRRRCGKSRLLQETLPPGRSLYFVADEREAALQRTDLSRTIERLRPGFAAVTYPDWTSLLERWWAEAPEGAVLALDEFPHLVVGSPELPSVVQRLVERPGPPSRHTVIAGSSQRMMLGLVLAADAPLYGRAREILAVGPLAPGELRGALGLKSGFAALAAYAVWGGVPRYWELSAEQSSLWDSVARLVLDPLGVLHQEPERLLRDDLREIAQAASVLSLVGRGVHRMSELASRLGRPATSLSRPLVRLQELGLVTRDVPFGQDVRAGGKSLYRISDPFLAFWYRFVEPNRSVLATGLVAEVLEQVKVAFEGHLAQVWEQLVRSEVPRKVARRGPWREGRRWWGRGADGLPLEVDLVAESLDGQRLLVGEAKLRAGDRGTTDRRANLAALADRLPFARRYREVVPVLCVADAGVADADAADVTADDLL